MLVKGKLRGCTKKSMLSTYAEGRKKHHLDFLTRQRNICLPLSSLYSVPILGVGDGWGVGVGGWAVGRVHTVESILVVCEGINKRKWEQ